MRTHPIRVGTASFGRRLALFQPQREHRGGACQLPPFPRPTRSPRENQVSIHVHCGLRSHSPKIHVSWHNLCFLSACVCPSQSLSDRRYNAWIQMWLLAFDLPKMHDNMYDGCRKSRTWEADARGAACLHHRRPSPRPLGICPRWVSWPFLPAASGASLSLSPYVYLLWHLRW